MEFNPLDPAVLQNPYPVYRELRQNAPVCQTPAGIWALSRYEDVAHVFKNPAVFSSSLMRFVGVLDDAGLVTPQTRWLVGEDPPVHTRLRNLVNRAFTMQRISQMEARVREIVDGLLDKLEKRTQFDLVRDFSMPLPMAVIAEMLGVDPALAGDFKRWSDDLVQSVSGMETAPGFKQSAAEFSEYFSRVIEERTKEPRQDLLSALVEASQQEGNLLTTQDVRAFALLLLVAGNETTTNLISNTMVALLQNPGELAKLRADLSLVPKLVEEALRFEGPAKALLRSVTQDVELAGVKVSAGEAVMVLVNSANHDDAKFPDGDRFDIERDSKGHIAFGHGIHFCLGAVLARLETRIAFERLIPRFPTLALAEAEVPRVASFVIRGCQRVPLSTVPQLDTIHGTHPQALREARAT